MLLGKLSRVSPVSARQLSLTSSQVQSGLDCAITCQVVLFLSLFCFRIPCRYYHRKATSLSEALTVLRDYGVKSRSCFCFLLPQNHPESAADSMELGASAATDAHSS